MILREGYKIQPSDRWEVTVATNFEQIEAIRPIWEKMQICELYSVPNAHIDRYLAFIDSMKESSRPLVIILSDEGRPKAMVIGRIEKHEIACRLGYKNVFNPKLKCLTIVYGGILGQPDKKISTMLIAELTNLLRQREADVIFFNYLPVNSDIYKAVRHVPGFWVRSHFPLIQQHWETTLPDSSDGIDRLISKKQKRDINRCIRNLEKTSGALKLDCYCEEKDIDIFIKMASQISSSSYQAGLGRGFVDDLLTLSILSLLQEKGWLRAYVLYSGSEPIAFEYGCIINDRYFAECAAYDARLRKYGPGTILQVKIFEQLSLENGVIAYDYGFGDAVYKQRLGNISWPEASVYIFAPSPYPVFVNFVDSFVKVLSIGATKLINKLKLTARMKRWWRSRLLWSNKKSGN